MSTKVKPSLQFTLRRLQTLDELQQFMPFFLDGFETLRGRHKLNMEVDREGFVKTLIGVINSYPRNGIIVAVDSDDNPIAFGVAFDDTPRFSAVRVLLLWAIYSRAKSRRVAVELFNEAEDWAREQGYERLVAYSTRFSGAAFRFFEKDFGMRRSRVYYSKDLD